MVNVTLKAAEALSKEGIDAEVIDLMSIRPIDYDTIVESVKKTNRVVLIEESWPVAGMMAEISHIIQRRAFDHLDAPVHRITGADTPMSYAPTMVEAFLPNVDKIAKEVKEVMYIKA